MVAVRDTHPKTGFDLNEWMTTLDLPEADKQALFSVFEYCHNLNSGRKRTAALIQTQCRDDRYFADVTHGYGDAESGGVIPAAGTWLSDG